MQNRFRLRSLLLGFAVCHLASLALCEEGRAQTPEIQKPGSGEASSIVWNPSQPVFGRAAAEVLGINLTVWSYDRFVREGGANPEFRVGTNSFWENIKNRFEWDNNSFGTNNFAHPYHGNLYYTAARSNGYGYWESIPFVFAGSYLWEFTGERNNPAYNDWLNTSLGGVTIGESLYRLSDLVLDNTATGSGRFWRELGGLLISPVRGINRIITGEWSRVGPNSPDRFPNELGFRMESGLRNQSRERVASEDTSSAYVSFDFHYGDPIEDEDIRPFDNFTFSVQLNFNDVSTLGRMQIDGLLLGKAIHESERTRHIIGGYSYFDYIDNRGFEFGGQTAGALLLSRYGSKEATLASETTLGLGVVLLSGTSSEVANFTGRNYDYGSGVAYRAGGRLLRKGRMIVELDSKGYWLYTLNGILGTYLISISHLQLALPIHSNIGLGVEGRGYYRKALYKDLEEYQGVEDVSHWLPEFRIFFTLAAN